MTRVKIPRWNVTPAHNSTLHCDPGSWFHVEVRPQVSIQRWIVTPSHDSTLNCHLALGSQFNVEFWPRVIIQRGILTRGYNSTWNSDPSTYLLPVELRLKKVSKFNSVIKIQQLRRVTIQRKIHWILTPGRYSIGGSKFYLTPPENSSGGRQITLRSALWPYWIFVIYAFYGHPHPKPFANCSRYGFSKEYSQCFYCRMMPHCFINSLTYCSLVKLISFWMRIFSRRKCKRGRSLRA